jgi:hypothetical protein
MTYVVVNHTNIWSRRPSWSWSYGVLIYNYICLVLLKYKGPSWSWSYGGVIYSCKSHQHMITTTTAPCISVMQDICSCKSHQSWSYVGVIYNYICHTLLKYKGPSWSWLYGGGISVIYDICSCKSHLHMITTTKVSCISVIHDICSWIQGAVVVVIICWCDLQLHMSCIT